mmetsp:Transcript_28257/g.40464  ORF Transcript_28257/g.40464 Transcript_28257/m.40464 type:complete len:246 (+) Transcript_28257:184-921(+)
MNVFSAVLAPASFAQPGFDKPVSEERRQNIEMVEYLSKEIQESAGRMAIEMEHTHPNQRVDSFSEKTGTGYISLRRRRSRRMQSCNFSIYGEILSDVKNLENTTFMVDRSYDCFNIRVDTPTSVQGSPETAGQSFSHNESQLFSIPDPPSGRESNFVTSPALTFSNSEEATNSSAEEDSKSSNIFYDGSGYDCSSNSAFNCSCDSCCSFETLYDNFREWCEISQSRNTPPAHDIFKDTMYAEVIT